MINIILYRPEKPANVGNIMRSVSAIDGKLIIIGPLSFEINDYNLKRAGMDYLIGLNYEFYNEYEDFIKIYKDKEIFYITRYGEKVYSDIDYKSHYIDRNLYFMFGRESTGIPKEILSDNIDYCLRIPMSVEARSLNLSNCVAIIAFEALRQLNYENLATRDFLKGDNYLNKKED